MNEVTGTIKTSAADSPDLDWSQVMETVRMLNLSVAQINMAMKEGDDSVESLTSAFTDMVGRVNDISDTANTIEVADNKIKGDILGSCASVQGSIQQTIVAFQFYDRLSQRLEHVQHVLEDLSGLVSDNSRLFNPSEWDRLQKKISGRYTMKEEQDMFEALLAGASIDEALDIVRQKMSEGDIDDIELF